MNKDNDEFVMTLDYPFTYNYEKIEVSQKYFSQYQRIIQRAITERIEYFGLKCLVRYPDQFCIVGKRKSMRNFHKWYKREIIKYKGLRLI